MMYNVQINQMLHEYILDRISPGFYFYKQHLELYKTKKHYTKVWHYY